MNELQNLIWQEKYRPSTFEGLIFKDKSDLLKFLGQGSAIPSFIFHSSSPGTGKTSTAKLIIKSLECDSLSLNSSSERGIDTIREKINTFSMSLSGNQEKRCVFLDEADGLTKPAQDCLRNLMETYSDNCFFILSCNDLNKIISPIRSRCQIYNFDNPPRAEILTMVTWICEQEQLVGDLEGLIDSYYPDIRSMVKALQEMKISSKPWAPKKLDYELFLELIVNRQISDIVTLVYSGEFDIEGWNKWFFKYLFDNHTSYGLERCSKIAMCLADNEKAWAQNVNVEVMFLANILKIIEYIK